MEPTPSRYYRVPREQAGALSPYLAAFEAVVVGESAEHVYVKSCVALPIGEAIGQRVQDLPETDRRHIRCLRVARQVVIEGEDGPQTAIVEELLTPAEAPFDAGELVEPAVFAGEEG